MPDTQTDPGYGRDPHRGHEARLAKALADLVRQIDIADYRDAKGHPAKNNLAFLHAQAIADEFCVTHADICAALDRYGDDVPALARHIATRH
jgi:hypothetical protein